MSVPNAAEWFWSDWGDQTKSEWQPVKPRRRREIAATAGRAAVAGRSETDPQNRSGERRRGPRCEGDHVAACAATPGPDDTHAPRSLVDVLRRSAGGRCRLPAARDVAPHHTPGGGTTAERGDTVDLTEASPRANMYDILEASCCRRFSQNAATSNLVFSSDTPLHRLRNAADT